MADTVSFEINGRPYTVDLLSLAQLSSAPIGTWLDELINATRHGFTQAEIEVFLEAVKGRTAWRMNGMSEINLGERYAVLRLATRWSCDGLRKLAIDSLEKLLTPLEKLSVARAYRVSLWLVPAYTDLALRSDPLSVAEAQQLDAEDVVRIFSARESIFRHRLPARAEFVAAHFAEVVSSGSLAGHPGLTSHPALSAVVPLPSCRDNEAIISFDPSPASMNHQSDGMQHKEVAIPEERIATNVVNVDISSFQDGKFDDGVALLTLKNVHETVNLLSEAQVFPGKGKGFQRRLEKLLLAVLRRTVRQPDFLSIGVQFAGEIACVIRRECPGYKYTVSRGLASLEARWTHFMQSGTVPKEDKGRVMPSGLTPDAYRECMGIGQAFMAELAKQGFVREGTWSTHARGSIPPSLPPPGSAQTATDDNNLSSSGPAPPEGSLYGSRAPSRPSHSSSQKLLPGGPDVGTIISHLTFERHDAGLAWLTDENVDQVCQGYRAHITALGQPKSSDTKFLCAMLRRACDDSDFHRPGLQFLVALCEKRPQLMEALQQPVEWVVDNRKEFLRRPDMTPSPDQGKIVRRWQSPGMAPQLYKERVENACRFIINALERLPLSNSEWVAKIRTSLV